MNSSQYHLNFLGPLPMLAVAFPAGSVICDLAILTSKLGFERNVKQVLEIPLVIFKAGMHILLGL